MPQWLSFFSTYYKQSSNFQASTNVKQSEIAVELSITGNIHIFHIIIVQFVKETGIQQILWIRSQAANFGLFDGNVSLPSYLCDEDEADN
jgi:hypothetical protein